MLQARIRPAAPRPVSAGIDAMIHRWTERLALRPAPRRGLAASSGAAAPCQPWSRPLPPRRSGYLWLLTWLFTFFNTVRVFAYLPTMLAVAQSGESGQHSLWTWLTWLGANLTMAAWLYEQNGRRMDRAVAVNTCNAMMCLATVIVIVLQRI